MHRLRGIHILFIYLACAILCAATVSFFLPRIEYALFKELIQERQIALCRAVAGQLNSTLETAKLLLKLGASSPNVIKSVEAAHGADALPGRFDELARLFEEMDASWAPVLDFLVLNGQGDIIGGSGMDRGSRSMASYFAVPMQGHLYIGVPGGSARTGKPALRVAEPVFSAGVPIGVLALTLDLGKTIDNWRHFLEDSSRHAIFLLDAKRRILVHSDIAKSGTELEYAELFPRRAPGEYAATDYIRNGRIRMFAYVELPLTGWTVVVSSFEKAIAAGEGFGGGFGAFVFVTASCMLFLGLCVPLQAVFYAMSKKAFTRGQQASLLQSMEDGVMALNADGLITYMNPASERIVRAPKELLVGGHVHSVFRFRRFDEQSAAKEESPLSPHLQESTHAHFHGQLLWRADGSRFVGDVSLYPLDVRGKPRLFMLRLRDVTSERDLEERMRAVYLAADNAFLEWDEHLQMVGCTEECVRLFGAHDARDLLDDFIYRFSPLMQPDGSFSAQAGAQFLKRAFEQGFCRVFWRHRTREGVPLPCEVTLMRLLRGGRPGVLAHVRDVRFLLEGAPSDARQARLPESIDALPVGIGITVAGQCRFANPALQAMTGMQVGEPAPSLLMEALGALQAGKASDARAPGGYVRLPRPDGGSGDFLCSAAFVEYEGERGAAFCLADISGQKCLERELFAARETAEAVADARGRFLAMVSHEVRTPLNGVMGLLQLASLQEMDSELKDYLDTAFSLCGSLVQILSDILDLSKIESGSLSITAEEFSLDDTVRATLASFQEAVRDKNLVLHCDVDPSLPKKLFGDGGRVGQLLLNLVGNAVKYTQEGQIRLEILRTPARDPARLTVLFVVSDTGVGVSAERMPYIFEAFQRGEDGYVLRQTGVGLGLSIVRRLVQLMNGNLCLFSREGLGTENHLILSFELPAEAAEKIAETMPEPASAAEEREDWGEADSCAWRADAPRILVVDDEDAGVMTMQLLLGALGYPADVAKNGPQALQMLKERRYALVLMDMQLPEMNGYAIIAEIRAMSGLHALPIVALTAHVMHGDRERMLNRGFDACLTEPVLIDELQALLRRLTA